MLNYRKESETDNKETWGNFVFSRAKKQLTSKLVKGINLLSHWKKAVITGSPFIFPSNFNFHIHIPNFYFVTDKINETK